MDHRYYMSETTVAESETSITDVEDTESDRQSSDGSPSDDTLPGWFGESALQIGLALVGFFLLLAALGQLSGLDLIGMGIDAINTTAGRWIVVGVVVIALIVAAVNGFDGDRSG
jgi:hypothetical protein